MRMGPNRAAFDLVSVTENSNQIHESYYDRKLEQKQKLHEENMALKREELQLRKIEVQLKEEELTIRKEEVELEKEKLRLGGLRGHEKKIQRI
ncbi:unnamed protein product [Acanthoscelides obtectus]|uniref:Uncharacterized protein n=1 Tax=Acanthoscelides obtectus TaxID=200917 RepID=A0A9P0MD84_ACAOB|nr:unnamed protein product [Acanthoscelides obtectus]CAK1680783.1 hypothetical protein AOBTE_LOCUS32876 [Acanthoscelides obtectus]